MRRIKVHSKTHKNIYAVVDAEDFERCNMYHWVVNKRRSNYYAVCNYVRINGVPIKLHRFILGITDGSIVVDHKDGDGLNNRRNNLRPTTHANNTLGRKKRCNATASKYIGVTIADKSRKWRASCSIAGKVHTIGEYDNELKAAIMRDAVVREIYGEFARLNFPDVNLKTT